MHLCKRAKQLEGLAVIPAFEGVVRVSKVELLRLLSTDAKALAAARRL